MKKYNLENVDCHATLGMIEKRWGFPRRTLRVLLGMTKSGQSGRSMIEMLGVLAIIGVLSVGGIAGYSKAMSKYRINKTIEQITLIAGNVRTFFAPQKNNYIGLDCNGSDCDTTNGCRGGSSVDSNGYPTYAYNGCPIIKKAKILPDEMITLDPTGKKIIAITNPFGDAVDIEFYNLGLDDKEVSGDHIIIYGLPQEACIALATHDWSVSDLIAMTINEYDGAVMYDCVTGDYWDDDSVGCIYNKTLPISIDKAASTCSDNAELHFYFR